MKFGMSLIYAIRRFVFEFYKKNRMGDDVITFSQNNCQHLKFQWNLQTSYLIPMYNNIIYIELQVTLTDAEGDM